MGILDGTEALSPSVQTHCPCRTKKEHSHSHAHDMKPTTGPSGDLYQSNRPETHIELNSYSEESSRD